jgi:hypothetical protein
MAHKAEAKIEGKAKVDEKAASKIAAGAAKSKSKPIDDVNAELDENVQLDEEDNFL